MPDTAFSETDLKNARKKVGDLEAEHARLREEADNLTARVRQSGTDPLESKEAFDQIDKAYRASDEKAEELEEARRQRDRIADLVGVPMSGDDATVDGSRERGSGSTRSWGDQVVSSDAYQRLLKSGMLRSDQATISLDPVEVASRDQLAGTVFQAQTIGSHGPLVPEDQRLTPPVFEPQREIMVLDMVTVGQTDSDQVEYAEETSRTSGAGGAAFGTALGEFDISWQRVTVNVRRRGAMHTATRGNLADQGQLRTIIDALLEEDVRLEAEDQIVGGDGTGENFTGVYNTAGIGSVTRQSGEALTDVYHRGITTVRLARRRDPTALLVHPNNHEDVILSKDNNDAYRMGPPTQSDRRTMWGIPAVPSTVATEDLPVWGRWADATLWLREGLTVSAFNQHEDYASRGLVLIVAEHRAAFRVLRPSGFATVDTVEAA